MSSEKRTVVDLTGPSTKRVKQAVRNESPSTDDWPNQFKELETIHFRLNSYYTFLSSRKHIITTFDLLKDSAEKVIGRDLELVDVARISYLIPEDVLFGYYDENQFVLEEKHFTWRDGFMQKETDIYELDYDEGANEKTSKQLLVFEFIDGNPKKSKTYSSYTTEIKVPVYTALSIKRLINKRNHKFKVAVANFLEKCKLNNVDDPWIELTKVAIPLIPKPKNYIDPIEEMVQNTLESSSNDEERPSIPTLIEKLEKAKFYKDQIVSGGQFEVEPKTAKFGDLNFELTPMLKEALKLTKGIDRFYSHQAAAMNEIHEGKNVIISTSTSSGKSLIYQVPVVRELELDPSVTAMYIFPTKALAQDQRRSLKDLLNQIPVLRDLTVETYDGDTEKKQRDFVRSTSSIIFTNPDMLHASILPNHHNWRRFICNLRYVVIDELHMYKGLFGSHVSLIMRRLRRICSMLGNNNVTFISCSATLKDPKGHMNKIFEVPIETISHIDEDGSPSGGKHLVVWNPPYLDNRDPSAGRENFISETAKIVIELMENNIRTIVFCVVRKVVELLMKEIRHILTNLNKPELLGQAMSYRGGYAASDRRKIEQRMFHGNLKAVISTNALELGIDIGSLDAVVMCGFPLSIANFHQQSGRAGRRNKDSLTLVVGSDDPVSRHYMKHPEELIKSEYPDLPLDFDNILVLEGHLQCAAFEMPFNDDLEHGPETEFFGDYRSLQKICETKLEHDPSNGTYHCSSRFLPWPASHVSIRAIEEDTYAVVDMTNNRNVVIEEIEASRTSFTLYDGGIFIHQGLPYLVREFNPDERYAKVERVTVDWTTSQRDFTNVDPVEIEKIRSLNSSDVPIYFGKIETTIVVFGFFKMDRKNKILDAVEVNNPPVIIKSKGLWIDIPRTALDLINLKDLNSAGGIHAAQHSIMNILPMYIISGLGEIQTECKAPEKEFAKRQSKRQRPARLILFDNKGGQFGSGLSTKAFDNIDVILEKALFKLLECDCDWGCPDCCAASFCKENSLVLSKYAAIIILATILGKKLNMDSIPQGPEENMPEVVNETIIPVSEVGMVKYSKDVEIIDVKPTDQALKSLKEDEIEVSRKPNLSYETSDEVKVKDEEKDDDFGDDFSDDELVLQL
ncbi:hypothetical protein CANARDRAFT_26087 [[Candida] arabinofermentans NRRL YB-2248]|uniref:RNA helicase n=1 Tax=[Candida] arabinofermentans NRRL YB-2248 TaxID=983967 RepID=A0A1E4T846_9ASCO|nr:hypothetical protein CANARDRAFT_26087 [[Candida] arabinofermentans NRRL YB-2248]